MSFGEYRLEIGGHNVTDDVERSISVQRGTGLNLALSPTRPGQLDTTLLNLDGQYNPAVSPIRKSDDTVLTVVHGGEPEPIPIFRGYLDQPRQDLRDNEETTALRAYGPLSRFANKRRVSTEVFQNIPTGVAIGHVLDALRWPQSRRDLDTGIVMLRWWWLVDQDPLQAMRQITLTEGVTAMLYESADGNIVFRNRYALYTHERSVAVQQRYGVYVDV